MNILKVIILVIDLIGKCMKTLENTITEQGQGATKKQIVLALIKGAVGDDIYANFEPVFSLWINIKALLSFGSSGDDPVESVQQ